MKKSYLIGAIVIALALAYAMSSFRSSMTSYVSVKEAKAGKRIVQVAGIVVKGSERYDLKSNYLYFILREDSGDEMLVKYTGPKPSNFDDATKVVSIGKYDLKQKVFEAGELLVKCPTKYEGRVKG